MLSTLAGRLASAALTLGIVSALVFALIHCAPGDPLAVEGEGTESVPAEFRAKLRELYHLDEPLPRQYLRWIGDVARGRLGLSFHDRRPVWDKIVERLGITLALNALALLVMVVLSLALGLTAALHPGSVWDRAAGAGSYVLYAVPVFWAGLLLQLAFSVRMGWLPLAGLQGVDHEGLTGLARWIDRARHMVLPVLCLSYGGMAYLSRFVRASLLEPTAMECWRAALARGLAPRTVLRRHGMRLAGVPLLTLAGFLLPALVGGSVIVETIFAIPGLGRLFVDAAYQRDVPVLMGLTLLTGAATLAGILAADLTYSIVDPRIRRARP